MDPREEKETLIGDSIARARRAWLNEISARLAREGFLEYRRSDAFLLRRLQHASRPLGEVGHGLSITRQGVRKLIDGLEQRGYAMITPDTDDARRSSVTLTSRGAHYAERVLATMRTMHDEVARVVTAEDLSSTIRVLEGIAHVFGDAEHA